MKAVCDFTVVPGLTRQGDPFRVPACFLPLMGKAFVQHIVEYVERLGVRELAVYISQYADDLEKFIGDGERWGVKIAYHLVKRGQTVRNRIAASKFVGADERFLFCSLLSLPLISREELSPDRSFRIVRSGPAAAGEGVGEPISDGDGQDGDPAERSESEESLPTGWFWGTLAELKGESHGRDLPADCYLLSSGEEYLESLRKAFENRGKGLIFFGKEIREGIWTGPGTKIAPDAVLNPPIYIDSQVSVAAGAIVGPFSELGRGSVVDTGSYLTEASVLPGSYIGKNLDLKRCIVNQNQVLQTDLAAVYSSVDEFIVSPVDSKEQERQRSAAGLLARLLALVLALVTLPLQLVLLAEFLMVPDRRPRRVAAVPIPQRRGAADFRELEYRRMLQFRTAANLSGSLFRHLLRHVVPGLWAVAAGRMRFFGLPLKTKDEFEAISKEWQGIYLRSKPGLIAEADILYHTYPADETLFAAEMFYCVNDSPRYNLNLLRRYATALFRGREFDR